MPSIVNSGQPSCASWSPPPAGFIKVNTVVGFPNSRPDSWSSMIARDSTGRCVWWGKKMIVGRPKPVDGEALAMLNGLQVAVDHGWRNVILETDRLQLINCLSRNSSLLA